MQLKDTIHIKKNMHIGASCSVYIWIIFFGTATTEEQNSEKYIIQTRENIPFGPSSNIYMGNIFLI